MRKGKATTSASVKFTLVFPTKWDTNLAKFVSKPQFNAILTELGRLAAADSNQEQEIFHALSYLINKDDFESPFGLLTPFVDSMHEKNFSSSFISGRNWTKQRKTNWRTF